MAAKAGKNSVIETESDGVDRAAMKEIADNDDSYDGLTDSDILDGTEGGQDDDAVAIESGDAVDTAAADDETDPDAELASLDDDDDEETELDRLGQQTEQPRDQTGRFAPKAGDAKDAKPGDAKDDKAGTAPAAGAKPGEQQLPTQEPLVVKIDKAAIPIDEAKVIRTNGHHLFAVKDADAPKFIERVRKGIAGEKMWRQLVDGLSEVEAMKNAPQPRSDVDIEAEIILEMVKPHLAELFDERDLETMRLKVELAQKKESERFADEQAKKQEDAAKPARDEQQRAELERAELEGLAEEVLNVVRAHDAELKGLDADGIKAAYQRINRVRAVAYRRDGDKYVVDRDLILDHLRDAAALKASRAAAPPEGTTAAAGAKASATANAERFNRGAQSGARPGSTSVKAGRGKAGDPRPRGERTTQESANPNARSTSKAPVKTAAMDSEDTYRKKERKWMSSNSLDIDDDDEE